MSIAIQKPKREPLSVVEQERAMQIHQDHCFGAARKEALAMVEATREALRQLSNKRVVVAQA